MEFEQIKTKKVYEEVIIQIKKMIFEGKLKRGDKLPSERKLKEELNVSRASIREAFSALEIIGIIESRPGEGTFIKEKNEKNILEPLSLILILEENSIEELLELRKILELDTVRLAAKRADDNDLEEMAKYIEILNNASGYEEESVKADRNFHYTIARASKNKVLYDTMISISEAMDFHIENTRSILISKPEAVEKFLQQHIFIYNAISEKDVEKAYSRMEEHLNLVEKLVKKEIEL
ncbi:FadR/GntR family transcriptional regulator [Natronospora cellulosivora (SeqCode)]